MIELSVVIPVYYNAGSLRPLLEEFETVFSRALTTDQYEMIFVDDGSPDSSLAVLKELAAQRPNLKIIKLSRNFGQVPAILAGLSHASGNYAAFCSADGQDPPSLILEMFEKARTEDLSVVIGTRESRNEALSTRVAGYTFSLVMRKLALPDYPVGGFDCLLMSRRCYEEVTRHPEKSPFIQGQVLWLGFPMGFVPYHRRARMAGRSRWGISRKLAYLWNGLVGYSFAPIHMMTLFGFAVAAVGFLYAIVVLAAKVFYDATPVGWAPLMVVILVFSGVQLMMLGVIGQYLRRTYDEARSRPVFLVEDVISHSGEDPGRA